MSVSNLPAHYLIYPELLGGARGYATFLDALEAQLATILEKTRQHKGYIYAVESVSMSNGEAFLPSSRHVQVTALPLTQEQRAEIDSWEGIARVLFVRMARKEKVMYE